MDRAGHQVPAANTTLARQPDFLGPAHACRSNTYYDEPMHGRDDGKNYNFGLVDIRDEPYEPLIAAARSLYPGKRKPSARPDASLGVPPAPRDPLGQFTIRRALMGWDRERGFVKPRSEFPVADLYVCWNPQAVYLGLYAQDIVEETTTATR